MIVQAVRRVRRHCLQHAQHRTEGVGWGAPSLSQILGPYPASPLYFTPLHWREREGLFHLNCWEDSVRSYIERASQHWHSLRAFPKVFSVITDTHNSGVSTGLPKTASTADMDQVWGGQISKILHTLLMIPFQQLLGFLHTLTKCLCHSKCWPSFRATEMAVPWTSRKSDTAMEDRSYLPCRINAPGIRCNQICLHLFPM